MGTNTITQRDDCERGRPETYSVVPLAGGGAIIETLVVDRSSPQRRRSVRAEQTAQIERRDGLR